MTGTASPAAALTGPIPCPSALPTARAVDGLRGTGFTVERGTVPEPFTARVLGRISGGIAPGVDLIMAELDSPALRRAGGVWQGMSGSPVYTESGQLIGAVSYGLSFGPSRIAGLTPGVDLRALVADQPAAGSGPGLAAGRLADTVALSASASGELSAADAAQAAGGFSRLQLPLSLSGAGSRAAAPYVDRLAAQLPGARVLASGAPAGAPSAGAPGTITAAGNLAAALSTGDVTAAGVGTATLVCGGTVVGFGHPLLYNGVSSYTMHPAKAVYVQPDPTLAPFKVANPGGVVGKVDRDRLTGIRGTFATRPSTVVVRSTLTSDDGTSRTGTTRVSETSLTPVLAAIHTLVNVELVQRAFSGGSASTTLTITGSRAGGAPFSLVRKLHVADQSSLGFAVADDVYATVSQLLRQPYEKVRLSGISISGTVSSRFQQLRVTDVKVKQAGTYVPLTGDQVLSGRAGQALPVRVTLAPYQDATHPRVVDLVLPVPASAAGFTELVVSGGERPYYGPGPDGPEGPESSAGGFDALLRELRTSLSSSVSAALGGGEHDGGASTELARVSRDTGVAVAPFERYAPLQIRR